MRHKHEHSGRCCKNLEFSAASNSIPCTKLTSPISTRDYKYNKMPGGMPSPQKLQYLKQYLTQNNMVMDKDIMMPLTPQCNNSSPQQRQMRYNANQMRSHPLTTKLKNLQHKKLSSKQQQQSKYIHTKNEAIYRVKTSYHKLCYGSKLA